MLERETINHINMPKQEFAINSGLGASFKSYNSELVGRRSELIKGSEHKQIFERTLIHRDEPKSGKEEWSITEGEWVTYKKGSELELSESLQKKNTGLCIEEVDSARKYLTRGDWLIFSSYNSRGEPVNPRVAIHTIKGKISRVRGVANDQNIDPYIADSNVIVRKLDEFPDNEFWKKKVMDMENLTKLERKQKNGDEFTGDERMFLYEVNKRIDGFGKSADPRIDEIRKERNQRQDFAFIFDCKQDQVAFGIGELKEATIAYIGNIDLRAGKISPHLTYISGDLDASGCKDKKLPDSLKYVGDTFRIEHNSQTEELPNDLTYIGRNFYGAFSKIKKFPPSLFSSYHFLHGNFDIGNTEIEEFPKGLTRIEGILSVQNTQIAKFHDGLTHVGGLSIGGSKIKETDLSANLKYKLFR